MSSSSSARPGVRLDSPRPTATCHSCGRYSDGPFGLGISRRRRSRSTQSRSSNWSSEPPRSRRLQGTEADQLLAACGPQLASHRRVCPRSGDAPGRDPVPPVVAGRRTDHRRRRHDDDVGISPSPFAALHEDEDSDRPQDPISSRLKGILELRRLDPTGKPYPPTAYRLRHRDRQSDPRVPACVAYGRPEVPRAHAYIHHDGELDGDVTRRAGRDRPALPRPAAGVRFSLDGRRYPVSDDSTVARALQHRPNLHLLVGHAGQRT